MLLLLPLLAVVDLLLLPSLPLLLLLTTCPADSDLTHESHCCMCLDQIFVV
jgi:hypothetical protein